MKKKNKQAKLGVSDLPELARSAVAGAKARRARALAEAELSEVVGGRAAVGGTVAGTKGVLITQTDGMIAQNPYDPQADWGSTGGRDTE